MSLRTARPASMMACTRFTDSCMVTTAPPAGLRSVHATSTGAFLAHRQPFVLADLHRDGVGVAISHQAARRTAPGHAKPSRVVNDDEARAAFLDEFGADAGARPGGDD